MSRNLRRILVCRSDAIGDSLLTLPVCSSLKQVLPQAHVTFLVSAYTVGLYQGQRHFDQLLVYDPGGQHKGRSGLQSLIKELKQQVFDAALMVYPDLRLSWAVFRACIPIRIGTSRRWWSFLYNQPIEHSRKLLEKHEADYNLDLVRKLGFNVELHAPKLKPFTIDKQKINRILDSYGILPNDQLVIVHPGGRGSSANWTKDAYSQMIAGLIANYKCRVLLTGTEKENTYMEQIVFFSKKMSLPAAEQPPIILKEKINLRELMALINRADVFVSGNTGPMHIAAAVNTPLIAIFPPTGVTGPQRWAPLGEQVKVYTAKDILNYTDNDGIAAQQINPEEVTEQIIAILKFRVRK